MDTHAEIQMELQAVKQALRSNAGYLGMQGETLQRYFLQLNEKDNLLLSKHLRHMGTDSPAPLLPAASPEEPKGAAANGVGSGEAPAAEEDVAIEPNPPPPGPVKTFNRERLPEVVTFITEYEAVPNECTRALRALASLAYADAQGVGENAAVLDQVLRLLRIHTNDMGVHVGAMRALCNMAYNQSVAIKRLSTAPVMSALLEAMSRKPETKDLGSKASEAMARIIAAEVQPELEGAPPPKTLESADGGLCSLFLASSCGKPGYQDVIPGLLGQLVTNEVVAEVQMLAKSFTWVGTQVPAQGSAGWLSLAKQLAVCDCPDLPQAMVDAGSIGSAAQVMEHYEGDGATQLAGIEAMSSLVGSRWVGLLKFAEVGGMKRIEVAMRRHGPHAVLQTKGVRAMASGILWPPEVQDDANYDYTVAVELTKAAMAQHGDCAELQAASLEGLAKYLDKKSCVDLVTGSGGRELVKAMIARHKDDTKVDHWGKVVLGAIGEKLP